MYFVIGVQSEDEDFNIIIYTTMRLYDAKLPFRYLVNKCADDERSV